MDFNNDTFGTDVIRDALASITINQEMTRNSGHYEISFSVAYLLGVPKNRFDEHEPSLAGLFGKLEMNKHARIIRNLCIVRNNIENNFMRICNAINQEYKSITTVPEYVSQDAIMALNEEGIDLYKFRKDPNQCLRGINLEIKNRINNCRSLFPDWLDWKYLSDIFIMPNGTTDEGLKAAAAVYYANKNFYPYQVYLNWTPEDSGNILHNDQRFVTLLYKWNNDEFRDLSLVSDVVSERTKSSIYDFLDSSKKVVFIVDCENSDPYRLCAAIRSMDPERMEQIEKIVLYDDVHAASGWDILKDYIDIPIEYTLIERLKDNKSLADIKVTAGICKEYYENDVDSIILVSSDSDYWGLIETVPQIRFLVMVEHEKCSSAMKGALLSKNIIYCYFGFRMTEAIISPFLMLHCKTSIIRVVIFGL